MKRAVVTVSILFSFIAFIFPAQVKATTHKAVCPSKAKSFRCHSQVTSDDGVSPHTSAVPDGYGPSQFLSAYKLSGKSSSGITVAVIDAYDNPNIFSDLNTYSRMFGIPQLKSCSVSSGSTSAPCFQKIDQRGGGNLPKVDQGWALETAMDVEVVHALCQSCNILLVEADDSGYNNLMSAFDKAVSLGARVISNSYGSKEFSTEINYDSHFNHPGIAMTFSAGDSGYGVEYPAASHFVTAVGGTTLNLSGNSYIGESVWSGTGSGCSKYELKPSWQQDTKCPKRVVADISADADPETGAAVYDSNGYNGKSGWFKLGGTSLASPIIAALYALAGGVSANSFGSSSLYRQPQSLHDIVTGLNGRCKISYFCKGVSGYDGPSGLGSPAGLSAF